MEKVNWKVEGMTCSNCALSLSQYLEKQGMKNVKVNLLGGEVAFDMATPDKAADLQRGIKGLGYTVSGEAAGPAVEKKSMNRYLRYVLICTPFAIILLASMLPGPQQTFLMNPWLQLILCLPVYITGMSFFGRSALRSIRQRMPNMNVLITMGATAAFVYSLLGTLLQLGHGYQFYETTAVIITLVFLGNYLEDMSVKTTGRALRELLKKEKTTAHMLTYDHEQQEHIFPMDSDQLRSGDLILIRSGEKVPADCKILWGEVTVNESIITGESLPVNRQQKDLLTGGSIIVDGSVKAQVMANPDQSVLSRIMDMVRQAQAEKPPVQKMADRISALFVPLVVLIAVVCFAVNIFMLHDLRESMLRSIAVLVIACPCAMGLATPAALAVGLGRAARNGILFRNTGSLEMFRNIRQVVFDKTGTLTTGNFRIKDYRILDESISDEAFRRIVYSLEKYSNHPIAGCISNAWKSKPDIRWNKVEEVKGRGMQGTSKEGDCYEAGSFKIVESMTNDNSHQVYITRNGRWIGWIDMEDELRPEAPMLVRYFKQKSCITYLISGDQYAKTKALADQLGIDHVMAEQTPEQKQQSVQMLNTSLPTAMIGDGINDAPALASASIGISLSEASQLAIQTADVVLMQQGLSKIPLALGLGRHTYITIKQNLFWAFIYNIIAIPVAAFGLLSPALGALLMGLSDVVLAFNSMRLFVKKVE